MPSPVAYGHDYEAQLGQTVDAVHPRCPEIFGGLYLRSGIDVFYDGVELGGVKVKRLVDDTPEVGDAVGGFGLEYLGELVTGHEQLAEITGLQIHDFLAGCIVEGVGRSGVHSGGIVDEVPVVVRHVAAVVHVAGVEHPYTFAVQVCAEEVVVVGILLPVISGGGEEYLAGLLIHAFDGGYMVGSVGQRAYQLAVLVMQVELGPAVAL